MKIVVVVWASLWLVTACRWAESHEPSLILADIHSETGVSPEVQEAPGPRLVGALEIPSGCQLFIGSLRSVRDTVFAAGDLSLGCDVPPELVSGPVGFQPIFGRVDAEGGMAFPLPGMLQGTVSGTTVGAHRPLLVLLPDDVLGLVWAMALQPDGVDVIGSWSPAIPTELWMSRWGEGGWDEPELLLAGPQLGWYWDPRIRADPEGRDHLLVPEYMFSVGRSVRRFAFGPPLDLRLIGWPEVDDSPVSRYEALSQDLVWGPSGRPWVYWIVFEGGAGSALWRSPLDGGTLVPERLLPLPTDRPQSLADLRVIWTDGGDIHALWREAPVGRIAHALYSDGSSRWSVRFPAGDDQRGFEFGVLPGCGDEISVWMHQYDSARISGRLSQIVAYHWKEHWIRGEQIGQAHFSLSPIGPHQVDDGVLMGISESEVPDESGQFPTRLAVFKDRNGCR